MGKKKLLELSWWRPQLYRLCWISVCLGWTLFNVCRFLSLWQTNVGLLHILWKVYQHPGSAPTGWQHGDVKNLLFQETSGGRRDGHNLWSMTSFWSCLCVYFRQFIVSLFALPRSPAEAIEPQSFHWCTVVLGFLIKVKWIKLPGYGDFMHTQKKNLSEKSWLNPLTWSYNLISHSTWGVSV